MFEIIGFNSLHNENTREQSAYFYFSNNGKRFEMNEVGLGLTAMRDRVESVGGEFTIGTYNGDGCRIWIVMG